MADYQVMYRELFWATTKAVDILQKAQQMAEEIYIASEDTPLLVDGRLYSWYYESLE